MFIKGVILSSYGVNGYARVKSISNNFCDFINLKNNKVLLKKSNSSSVEVKVVDVNIKGNSLFLKFEEIDTPEAVRPLIGFELWVDDSLASSLKEGEYYLGKLIGYAIVNNNKKLGEVVAFFEYLNSVFLEVRVGIKFFFIPFLSIYIGDINTQEKTIELKVLDLLK
ncbi:ribosome maturation factor RimM [Borreliella burgdorferi]|uniref:Ribosome maturation factor RimM n=1 Tax=Borreliella burgdorferi (strain ATCC 35210 / DSM 4680 / CIP 102532 / B31) TaxID=224326 RepID=RIMM_BORBU|nr:ribosome maturation factor RimM [Borreliella burgdorferi]O51640.1 RecName: Full=Ribosome maturation factor RimM [Borreliella burgdorferi B31]AGS66696.1 16S rRNA-processing protein RimM [Borreliella burgdorferi CA382]AAC67046.1 16S rRNA processing protein RimM [Borreliella burgdorferi B31]ARS30441.1 ribosome maturation factor RimM [Borreliella burgdorferi]ARS31672.1 ribosome maturation factor RimM [Borreliella burgdorferi]ARS33419.1 ribosome maturation factor RimM [Borreliella burgdorferi]